MSSECRDPFSGNFQMFTDTLSNFASITNGEKQKMQLLPNLNFISVVGEILAKDFDCNFGEVAAADQVVEVSRENKS